MIAADLRRFGALVIAPVVAVLAACTPAASEPAPTPTPSPSPSQTPFAEKNAAAIEAYKRYEEMLEETGSKGGFPADDPPDSVLATTMGDERKLVIEDAVVLYDAKERTTGSRSARGIELRSSRPVPGAPGGHVVELRACRDLSKLKLQGPNGSGPVTEAFQEVFPSLYYDESAPAGWKVAKLRGSQIEKC
ncbi:hypothetical protein GGQ54_000905 [Naumannella cuiyingiana]|uniref:Lipoprotein n=1 Tax=Naumannella cuiyingiana TaxID=1347891 RepID=A0A7Z0D7J0_9ACTN|nr:hypothetical protein [Naumannella cuiyingiana]NYI70345.1 hypothetical protein [Naumannella cuiyingiana]